MEGLETFFRPHFLLLVASILVIFFQSLYFHLRYSPKKKIVKGVKLYHVRFLSGLILAIGTLYAVFHKDCFSSSRSIMTFASFIVIALAIMVIFLSRIQLGVYYSSGLELLDKHEYVKKGFYKYIDHPIYYSEFFIAVGLFFLLNHVTRYISLAICILELTFKIKAENRFLKEHFPHEFQPLTDKVKNFLRLCIHNASRKKQTFLDSKV